MGWELRIEIGRATRSSIPIGRPIRKFHILTDGRLSVPSSRQSFMTFS